MDIYFPTKIHFADDAVEKVAGDISENFSSCLIITGGARTRGSSIFVEALRSLRARLSRVLVIEGIHSNPREGEIIQAAKDARQNRPACILSIGAGSVHDAAKIVSVLINEDFSIEELTVERQGYNKIKNINVPLFCIPSMVGTGSEISPASLVRIGRQKRIIFSPHLYPKAAYYSFKHIGSSDIELDVLTAFDSFVQSLEALTSQKSNLWAEMYALAGIKNSLEGIKRLSVSGSSPSVWKQLSHASAQSLLAVANSSVGAIHALSDPLSGIYDIHHGRALALVAPKVLLANYEECAERYHVVEELISEILDLPKSMKIPEAVEAFLDSVAPNRKFGIPEIDLSDQGMARLIAESRNPDMEGAAKLLTDNEIELVFRSM